MVENVTRAIKEMSDGPIGPHGWTLKDLKALRREEVVAHFNVGLLADYSTASFCRTETVLIEFAMESTPKGIYKG